jgi:cytochrome c
MRKVHHLFGAAAALGLMAAAACSGGSEGPPPAPDSEGEEAPAVAVEADAAPTAESIDTIDGTVFADFTGDASAGAAVFAQCRACHVLDEGVNRVGPSLHAIVDRPAGTVEGFSYSDANANGGIIWTPEKLFQYLENPRRIVPGTRMAFRGLSGPQDRADLIAYLQSE